MSPVRKSVLATAAIVLAIVAGGALWLQWHMAQPFTLQLRFHPQVGAEPLVPGEARYANPGGAGRFAVRDFQFFVSNIRLAGADGVWAEPDSYHLLRFDAGTAEITLHGIPRGRYTRLELGIGVDPEANGSIDARGDLDPNGRMAWTWDVGYKFVLFEGTLELDGRLRPLVYHVGFSENYTPLAFPLDAAALAVRDPVLDYRVDVAALFGGEPPLDMAALSNVKFDHADAARLARNFPALLSPAAATSF